MRQKLISGRNADAAIGLVVDGDRKGGVGGRGASALVRQRLLFAAEARAPSRYWMNVRYHVTIQLQRSRILDAVDQ